jgi:phosphate uptake regulator
MEDPRNFDVALEAAFVLKSLERVGDHARNLARHVQWIGHDAPLPDMALPASETPQESHSSS